MFNVNVSQLGSVVVKTSEKGGLNNEQIPGVTYEEKKDV